MFVSYNRLIRLSSPNLNYLMIMGMVLIYSSGIAYGSPKTNSLGAIIQCFVRLQYI